MHTLNVLIGGFALLGMCLMIGNWSGGRGGIARGALAFVPLWLLAALANMYVGVAMAGYSVAAEAPIFLVIFGVPATVAMVVRGRFLKP